MKNSESGRRAGVLIFPTPPVIRVRSVGRRFPQVTCQALPEEKAPVTLYLKN